MPDIQRANMAVFALDENSTILISDETYNVNFKVSLYYPNDKVTEARIVGIKNGDPSTIKILKRRYYGISYQYGIIFSRLRIKI